MKIDSEVYDNDDIIHSESERNSDSKIEDDQNV